ncbi:L51_S25_CI-B8 domain-containing protein [Meloidogyne graminicola]|uniref:L51_S25_CI-B8 domain-containing protein n=1 Tax=Meloidogyne graminicola TaxID=189291 RepID=A0A8S9ZSJ0_9BILA|nr:L51_S25_CI-B8 domain-containing protein [Meloidogyne graminicola]
MLKSHPSDFGENCQRHCICEVQGQHPCTSLIYAPKHVSESWRWDHENYNPDRILHPKNKFVDHDLVERDPPGIQ